MSSNVYVALLSVLLMSAIIGGTALLTYLYFRLWRKGYRSPLVVLGIAAPSFVSFFLGLVIFHKNDRLATTNTFDPSRVGESFVNFALYWIGPPLIAILATALVVALLPRREVRRFGTRQVRFPWRKAGRGLVVLAGLLLLFDWGFGWHVIKSTRIVTQVLLPTYVFCLWMSRRAEAPAMADVLKLDPRPPVLYLRAFENEAEVFAELTLWELGAYAPYIGNKSGVTLEQYLGPSISKEIGPFIGLGSPEDYLPPEGAARMYADDKDWTRHFEKLSHQAACIIMEVDQSENLRWELQSLSSNQLHRKLFIVTRPRRKQGWRHVRIHLGRLVMLYIAKCKGIRSASWAEFAQAVGSTGYKLEMMDPGPGAVIAIDSQMRGRVIITGAVTPTDFLAPIKQWMEEKSSHDASPVKSKEGMAAVQAAERPTHGSSDDDRDAKEVQSLSQAAPQEHQVQRVSDQPARDWYLSQRPVFVAVAVIIGVVAGLAALQYLLPIAMKAPKEQKKEIDYPTGRATPQGARIVPAEAIPPLTADERNSVAIRPLKSTFIKVIVDGGRESSAFQRWISPADDTIKFLGKHISIRVLDRDAVEITKNGRTLEEGDEDVTVD